MAMDALLPSEIARMVYGYLLEERCTEAARLFLRESSNLEECRQVLSMGRHFSTRVCGLTLLDVLEKFCLLNTIVQEKLENFDKLDKLRHCSDLTSQIKVLFEEYKGRNFIPTVNTATQSTPSLHGSPSKFRKRRIFSNKDDDKTKRNAQEITEESEDNSILDQSPSKSIEATPLKNLPGYTGEFEPEKHKKLNPKIPEQNSFKSTPQKNTVSQNAHLQKVQKVHQNIQLQEIQKDEILIRKKCPNFNKDVNFQTENLIKYIDSEVQTESCAVTVLDKNIMTETEQKTYTDTEVQTSDIGSPESEVQVSEILGEFSEKLLNRTEAVEKIVENINTELKPIKSNLLEKANDDAKEAYSKSFIADLNKAIEAAANKSENDPEIIDLINAIVLPPEENLIENNVKLDAQCGASYSSPQEKINSISEETVSERSIEKDVVVINNNVNKNKILESKNWDKSRNTVDLKNSANLEINSSNQIVHQVDPRTRNTIMNSTDVKQVDSHNSQMIVSKENNMRHNTETLFNSSDSLHLQKRCTSNSDDIFSHNNTITSTPIKTFTAVENFDSCDWFSTQDLPTSHIAYYREENTKYVTTTAPGIYTSSEAIVANTHFLSPITSKDTNKIVDKINCTLANTLKDQSLHTPDIFFPPKISTAISVNSDSCPMSTMVSAQKNKTPTLQKSSEIIDQFFDIQSSQKSDKNLDNLSLDLKDNSSNDCNKYFNVDSVMLFGVDSNISSIPMPMYVQEIEIEDSITLTGTGLSPFLKVIKTSDNTETDNIKQNEKAIDSETSHVLSAASDNERIENNILESKMTENTKYTPTKVMENRPKPSRKSLSTPKKPNSYIRALNFDTPINRSQSESKVNNTDSCLSPDSLKKSLKNSCKSSLFQSPPFTNSEFVEQKTNTNIFPTIPESIVVAPPESKGLKKDSSLPNKESNIKPVVTEQKSWDSELRKNLGKSEHESSSSSKKRSRSESSRKSYKKAKKSDNTPRKEKKSYKKSSKKSKKDEKLNNDDKKKEDIKVDKKTKDVQVDIRNEETEAYGTRKDIKADKKKEDMKDDKKKEDIKVDKKKEDIKADKKKEDIKVDKKKEDMKADKRKEEIKVDKKKEEMNADKKKEDIKADKKKEDMKADKRKEEIKTDKKKEEMNANKKKEDIKEDKKKEDMKADKKKEDIKEGKKKEDMTADKRKEDIKADKKKEDMKADKKKEDIKADKKKEDMKADKKKEDIKADKKKEEVKTEKKQDDVKADNRNEEMNADKKKEDIKADKKKEDMKADKKKEDIKVDKKKKEFKTDKKKKESKKDKKKDIMKDIKKEEIKANKMKEEIETVKKKEQNKNEKESSKIKINNNSIVPLSIESSKKEESKEMREKNVESKSRVSNKKDEVKEIEEKQVLDSRNHANEKIVQGEDVIEKNRMENKAELFHTNNNKELENLEQNRVEIKSENIDKMNSENSYSINKEKLEPVEPKLTFENTDDNIVKQIKDPLIALLSDSINDDNINNDVNIQDEMSTIFLKISNQLTAKLLSEDNAAAIDDHTKEAAETPLEKKSSVDELEEELNLITNAEDPKPPKRIIYDEVKTMESGKVVQKKYARLKTLDDFAHDYEVPGKDDNSLQVPPTPQVLSPSSSSLILPLFKMSEDSRTFPSLIATPLECPKTPNIVITPVKGQTENTSDVPQKTETCYQPAIDNSDSSKKPEITQFEVIKKNTKPIVETSPETEEDNLSKIQAPMSYREKQDDNSTSSAISCSCDSCCSTISSESKENEKVEEVEGEANSDDDSSEEEEDEDQNDEGEEEEEKEESEESEEEDEEYEKKINKPEQEVKMTRETSPAKVFSINKTDEELTETVKETPVKDGSCPEMDIFDTPNVSKSIEQPTNLNTKISQMMILKDQENKVVHVRPKPKIINVKRVLPKVITKPPIKLIKTLPKNIQLQAQEIKNELATLPPTNLRLKIEKSEEEVALAIKSIENHKFNKSQDEIILLSATPSPANNKIDKNISNKNELAQAIESLTRTEAETIEIFGNNEKAVAADNECNSDANFKLVLEDDCEKEEDNSNGTGHEGNAQEDDSESTLNNSHSHNTRFQSQQRRKEKERRKLGNCNQSCQEIVITFNEETYKKKRRKGFSDEDLCPMIADEEHMCILRPTQIETLLDIRPKRKKPVRKAQGKKEKCLKIDENSHGSMPSQMHSNDSESIPEGIANVVNDEATSKHKRPLEEDEPSNKQLIKKRKKNIFIY